MWGKKERGIKKSTERSARGGKDKARSARASSVEKKRGCRQSFLNSKKTVVSKILQFPKLQYLVHPNTSPLYLGNLLNCGISLIL